MAVFSAVPAVQDLIPNVVQAIGTVGLVDKEADKEKVVNKDSKNQKEIESIRRTKSLNSGKKDKPNNGESKLVRNRRLNNKAKARKLSLNKIMPWILGTSAATVTTYVVYRIVKYFLSNSHEEPNEEDNSNEQQLSPTVKQTSKSEPNDSEDDKNSNKKKSENPSISTNSSSNISADSLIKKQTPELKPTDPELVIRKSENIELKQEENSKENLNSKERQPIIESSNNSTKEPTTTLNPTNEQKLVTQENDIKTNQEEVNENPIMSNSHKESKEEEKSDSKNLDTKEVEENSNKKKNENPIISKTNSKSNMPVDNSIEEKIPELKPASEPEPTNNVALQEPCFTEEYLREFLSSHLPDVSYEHGIKISSPEAKQKHVSVKEATEILEKAASVFENIPKVAEIDGPITVTSDFHGSSGEARDSILGWLNELKTNEKTHYLSLGDYQDRSQWGMETFLALVILKCTYPNEVTLLMGNHDNVNTGDPIGAYAGAIAQSDEYQTLMDQLENSGFKELFWNIVERLSLIAEVTVGDKRILCNHAAVPHDGYLKENYSNIRGRFKINSSLPEKTEDYRYDKLRGIFWDDYCDPVGTLPHIRNVPYEGRGMCVGLQTYEKVMKEAEFDYAISGHQHTNTSPITSERYPLFKVCSQFYCCRYGSYSAKMLIVRPNESDVSFTRKEYNESRQWVEIKEN